MKVPVLLLIGLIPSGAAAAAPSDAALLARVKASMRSLGGRFRDMDTDASLVMVPPRGSADAARGQSLTMTAHLYIKMPDRVKFQVLNSSFPLFNRWTFVQVGDQFLAYDPVSDRRVSTDFRRLTGREPARVDTSMATLGLLFDPSRYRFQWMGRTTYRDTPVYRVRLRLPKPQQLNAFTTVSYTDMYVDTVHLAPVRSVSYDPKGQVATSGEFREPKKTPAGWAPTRITITDHAFERIHARYGKRHPKAPDAGQSGAETLDKAADSPHAFRNGTLDLWIRWGNGVLFPSKMVATTPVGATSTWTFSNTRVNVGLKDSAFRL